MLTRRRSASWAAATAATWCLAALAFKPEEFAVGVDLFGVSNWVRTLRVHPALLGIVPQVALQRDRRSRDADRKSCARPRRSFTRTRLRATASSCRARTTRASSSPSRTRSSRTSKKRGGVVEYVVFDNEGHGFTKKANEIRAYKAILDFLDKYLKGGADAAGN